LGGAGIRLEGFNGGNAAVAGLHVEEVDVLSCGDVGFNVVNATLGHVSKCRFSNNAKEGMVATSSEVALYSCIIESNRVQSGSAELRLTLCNVATVESCRFYSLGVSHPGSPPIGAIFDRCGGAAVLRSNVFLFASPTTGSIGAQFLGIHPDPGGPCLILTNRFVLVETGIKIQQGLRYALIHPQYCQDVSVPIALPLGLSDLPIGSPTIRGPQSPQPTGLLLPRVGIAPADVVPGTLAYVNGELQAFVGSTASWRRVKLV
jgi:hypothetical protein